MSSVDQCEVFRVGYASSKNDHVSTGVDGSGVRRQ